MALRWEWRPSNPKPGQKQKRSFIGYDAKIKDNRRLRVSEIPPHLLTKNTATDEQADEYCNKWDAVHDAAKVRIGRLLEWRESYGNFNDLVSIYEQVRKTEDATNSWTGDIQHLTQQVLPFFLIEKNCPNMELWSDYFEDFRDWLMKQEPVKKRNGQTTYAYATLNRCISTLNTFMETMKRRNKLTKLPSKCRFFKKGLLNRRGDEAYMSVDVCTSISKWLYEQSDELCADAVCVSRALGVRENELFGIALPWVMGGRPDDKALCKLIERMERKYYGYVVLESQPALAEIRDTNGTVPRKPLKRTDGISANNTRIIPVFDEAAWEVIKKRHQTQRVLFKNKTHGDDPKNYLLFDGLKETRYYRAFKDACEQLGLDHSPHHTRHGFCTDFYGVTMDFLICTMVTGHKKIETMMIYNHLFQLIQRNIKSQRFVENGLD